jgi:hypothetical protein
MDLKGPQSQFPAPLAHFVAPADVVRAGLAGVLSVMWANQGKADTHSVVLNDLISVSTREARWYNARHTFPFCLLESLASFFGTYEVARVKLFFGRYACTIPIFCGTRRECSFFVTGISILSKKPPHETDVVII